MAYFVGIDLGTTNSAICTYDGETIRIFKSPQQNDVTPSVIYIDRRSKYYGSLAYNNAARSPENAAQNFKRFMGTSTPIKIPAVNVTMTPEECSSEILKVLFSYLPEELRNSDETGTVITVPAAFNQMQRDATLSAAEMSGIGRVALMQEPVAAVMSVMKARNSDGTFLIYDLGGGTFDIALAESISRRVSLLEHGGIVMCGGGDFDRIIVDNIVKPWLLDNFDLPENFSSDPKYSILKRLAAFASERAKIELSMKTDSIIFLNEDEIRIQDNSGKDIYLDIPITQNDFDPLIETKVVDTINATREVLEAAHLTPNDIDRIVFIGGPTHYKPLRDMVSFELGISADTQLNPMTAVVEGAAIFAESIDWSSEKKNRKSSRGSVAASSKFNLSFEYTSRTSDIRSRITIKCGGRILPGSTFQTDNMDTGWSSGHIDLKDGTTLNVDLSKNGENRFKIFVFDPSGGPISIENNSIIITRTAATIDAIPASHSIVVAVRKNMRSSETSLRYLVKKGDSLPKKGSEPFKAAEALRAKGPGSLNFKLYEGEIESPIGDNEPIGCLKITGADFDAGVIEPGADLICEYEVSDSGRVSLSISVPSVGGTFTRHDFYSRQEGQIDYSNAGHIVLNESEALIERADNISAKVNDNRLDIAKRKLKESQELAQNENEPEAVKQAMQNVHEAKRIIASVRKEHLSSIRQLDLDSVTAFFQENIRQHAKSSEATAFDNMARSAKRAIESTSSEFENIIDQMRGMNWQILWRQDWFVVDTFKRFSNEEYLFTDRAAFGQLVKTGSDAVKRDDMDKLREVVNVMYGIRISTHAEQDLNLQPNIL
ncbi:MAG: Chaperone protein DnaK [Syntrophomonadaceae bacterium]|nr:Chaperone protein DnaK [Bacillota bacterium]